MRATLASVKFELLNDEVMENIQFGSGIKKDFSDLSTSENPRKRRITLHDF